MAPPRPTERRAGAPPAPGRRPTTPGARPPAPRPSARAGRPGRRRRPGRLWRWRRLLFAGTFLLLAAVAGGLFYLSRLTLPPAARLTQTSLVYDARGHVLTSYTIENRTSVPLSQVPPVLIGAVVSTEDRHFFSEGALNPLDILRALVSDVRGGGSLQGGSTITQQYVKQAYLTPQRTLTRKLEEAALAVKLGHQESKRQILAAYLNTIYFGRGAYGVQAAAEAYFGKPVSAIGLRESSLLAGLIREPDSADPAHDAALARRNQAATLRAMVRDHRITGAQAAAVEAQPLDAYVLPPSRAAAAGRTSVPGDDYFLAAVRQQLLARLPASEVDGGGLRVTTTLDPTLQAQAYDAVYGGGAGALHPERGDPAGALVSVDDQGQVRALVGGEGYGARYAGSQVDTALGAAGGGSGRQPGSTFKAFMLAYLVKAGYSVLSTFPAPPEVVVPHGSSDGTPWVVKNFEGEAGSAQTNLITATAQSINTVYAQVVERLGAANLTSMARQLGIPVPAGTAYPSEVLGTVEVSPLDMAAAYATFADGGTYRSPVLISRVTTASGKVLPWPTPTARQVLSAHDVAVIDDVLQSVVRSGTGAAAGGVGSAVAGKTGTTENSANAWFVGYTPHLTTAVWMGFLSGNIPMTGIRHAGRYYRSVQGGDIPAQLWHAYMAGALRAEPDLAGSFPPLWYLGGAALTPPPPGSLQFPQGMGSTTTQVPATTVPRSPATTAAPVTAAPTTGGAAVTAPATTSPPTAPPTTAAAPTTAAGGTG